MSHKNNRKSDFTVHEMFLNRWSPRAMSGESIELKELLTLFEAGRWAPSSYNGQPWRFIYALRQTSAWDKLFNVMIKFNQDWAKNASALVVVISKKTFDFNGKPARTHSFDAGSAWMSIALQGELNGLVVHGMEGFDYDRAKTELNIPDDYNVEMMFAVGKPGKKEDLPQEMQEREVPSDRKKLEELIFEGSFVSK
ncbi:nitroreductase family protein [Candidatus Dependentiae bacterium]|jgi:nitroreductase|nr:nitroreductase family protein [Candidatus Dependentiae bacterium]